MPASFPLFHLPYLPFAKIINSFLLDEVIKMSLISKKSYKLAKLARKKLPNDQIRVVFSEYSVGVFTSCQEKLIGIMEESECEEDYHIEGSVTINGTMVTTVKSSYYPLMIVWKDRLAGLILVMGYVVDFLQSTIGCLHIVMYEEYPNCLKNFIDSVSIRQQLIECCHIENEVTNEDLTYFLKKKAAKNLFLWGKPSDRFTYDEVFYWEDVTVMQGSWVTLSNLLGENIQKMEIYNSNLTSKDINAFLKNYLIGGSPKLKIMKIG